MPAVSKPPSYVYTADGWHTLSIPDLTKVSRYGVAEGLNLWDDRFVEDVEPLEMQWPYTATQHPSQWCRDTPSLSWQLANGSLFDRSSRPVKALGAPNTLLLTT